MIKLFNGDSLIELKKLEDNSVDSVVTDSPYGISFMGKKWDYDVPSVELWKEVYRVLKPGGHLLSFTGSRTYHKIASGIEEAGFEIRDMINWIYSTGFPKSMNIGKKIDEIGGQSLSWFIDYILNVADEKGISRKELTMLFPSKNGNPTGWLWNKQKTQGVTIEQYNKIKDFLQLPFDDIKECEREIIGRGKAGLTSGNVLTFKGENEFDLTKGNSEWEGWGTQLKPSNEPIVMARKPISEKTIVDNVLKWGTGAINIDKSRVSLNEGEVKTGYVNNDKDSENGVEWVGRNEGRFPANIIHDGSEEVTSLFPNSKGAGGSPPQVKVTGYGDIIGKGKNDYLGGERKTFNSGDGSASRFFYCAKPSRNERDLGLEGFQKNLNFNTTYGKDKDKNLINNGRNPENRNREVANHHPTIKPIKLMEYLVNLVTPKGGIVLDSFMGSGTTGMATVKNGFNFIGVEREKDYFEIAEARVNYFANNKVELDYSEDEEEQTQKPNKQIKKPTNSLF